MHERTQQKWSEGPASAKQLAAIDRLSKLVGKVDREGPLTKGEAHQEITDLNALLRVMAS